MSIWDITEEQLDDHRKWIASNGAEGARLEKRGGNYEGKDLSGMNLDQGHFQGAVFDNGNLDGISFAGADFNLLTDDRVSLTDWTAWTAVP